MVTHHGTWPSSDSPTSAIPMRALSAMGSTILPKDVTSPRSRAMRPSAQSVIMALMKTTTAATRLAASVPSSRSSSQPKSGTSRSRSVVSAFGRFTALGSLG